MAALKRLLPVLALAALGCQEYIRISDLEAERSPGETLLVYFKAERDVTHAAQFISASLGVPDQIRYGLPGWKEIYDDGHVGVGFDKIHPVTGEPGRYCAEFPLKGVAHYSRDTGSDPGKTDFPYDLTRRGFYELFIRLSGGNCGWPGGFYTNRASVYYLAP